MLDEEEEEMFVCLYRVYRSALEFLTHLETSPSLVKGCKFWPMLGTHGIWAVRVTLACHTYCDTGHPFI